MSSSDNYEEEGGLEEKVQRNIESFVESPELAQELHGIAVELLKQLAVQAEQSRRHRLIFGEPSQN